MFFAIFAPLVLRAQTQSFLRDRLFDVRVPDFSQPSYNKAVSALFTAYERAAGKRIARGDKGAVGLKIYTNSGAGLCTPKALVDAVVAQLEMRGYRKGDITIVDMSRRKLRDCGYLPSIAQLKSGADDSYGGINVADIESGKYFDSQWYYDNPLPPKSVRTLTKGGQIYDPELRKSYLPVPLFLTVDFWINLPVVTDMEGLGVCAAIGNATIWNMSNNERFLKQPANASMAAAEVSAIPELRDSEIFSVLSLERGQFVGGAVFNSRCTFSENRILLSANPAAIDYVAWEALNAYRRAYGFETIEPVPAIFNYCRELGVGESDPRKIRRITVPFRQEAKRR